MVMKVYVIIYDTEFIQIKYYIMITRNSTITGTSEQSIRYLFLVIINS